MARDNWDGCDSKYKGKVYVGGIGSDVTRSELEAEYEKYGSIRDVWIAHNPPGFAFVEFYEERDGRDAIRATDGTRICGYKVSVEASHGRKSKRKQYLEDVRCFNCNRWGHLAKVCTRGYGDYRDSSPRRGRSRSPRRRSRSRSPRRRSRSPRRRSRSPRRSKSRSPRRRSRSPLPSRSNRSRSRSRRRSVSGGRKRSPDRSRERSRSRKRSLSGERRRSKSKEKSRERSRSRSKSREKSREGRSRSVSRERRRSNSENRSKENSPARSEDDRSRDESVGREDFVKDEDDEMA